MMSSGSIVFFFDFDIFSIAADLDRGAGRGERGAALVADDLDLHVRRHHPLAVGTIGLVHHHALGEQAGERLVESQRGQSPSWRG